MAPSKRKPTKVLFTPASLFVSLSRTFFFLTLFILAIYFSSGSVHWPPPHHHLHRLNQDLRAKRLKDLCKFVPEETHAFLPFEAWLWLSQNLTLPQNSMSKEMHRRNALPPRNSDLFELPDDHLIFVLYVHNRPHYLRLVVESLSKIHGIGEVLLIVSHDGFYEEMNSVVESIRFCQVKQIFAPFSPHLFNDSFPGLSSGDCVKRDDFGCVGSADQYGNYRSPNIVSLKHHWWWMMNIVWDGLPETKGYTDHILFIEEDHYLFPNAYHNIRLLTALKSCKCPDCYAANLAPADVNSRGEQGAFLVAEKIGNMGYAFNRTVWRKIHGRAKEFCLFDEYNWDFTMWSAVYPTLGASVFTLRGPRASAVHFGRCGLHQGQGYKDAPCFDGGNVPTVEREDKSLNIRVDWEVNRHPIRGYTAGFKGWGGWGDARDHKLCLDFASMYHISSNPNKLWLKRPWQSLSAS